MEHKIGKIIRFPHGKATEQRKIDIDNAINVHCVLCAAYKACKKAALLGNCRECDVIRKTLED